MIVPDINLLVYAYNEGAPQHNTARRWWEGAVNGGESIGIPWIVSIGFIRLVTSSRVLTLPLSLSQATAYVQEWFEYTHITPLNPGTDHLNILQRNLDVVGIGTNLVSDAHIAALAMEYNAEVFSNDSDFTRFPGLRHRNPLETFSGPPPA